MKIKLKPEQLQRLKSMGKYWDEIARREDKKHMTDLEMNQMLGVISKIDVLLIVSEYVNNYKEERTP